ncbi:putative E3 ubiquitin-protein ligase LIN-1 [Asparagus officinalis]|nr:putative E3 ubiquitin-protein ligase LIN-1 [Asparagus officinalis]
MLGGYFSFSGETLTETWLLKQAGFCDDFGTTSISYDEDVDEIILEEENEEESREKEEWLKNVALVLLCSGKGSFLETLSKCLDSQNTELLKVCLTTIAWMSHALASLSLSDLQLSVFLSLIPRMKEILEKSEQIEHRILASLSLLNFSKISECRILLVSFAEEIHNPLKHLVEMTSIAKHLYATVFG